ncbi:MAG: pseudouridine synthase [Pseudomonadota bacterium]
MTAKSADWSRRYEGDEPVRLNKWLAQSGVCSRREAEGLITDGLVSIDGEAVEDLGRKILPGQTVALLGNAVGAGVKFTAVVNKPVGYVSSQPEKGQIPAARLITREHAHGAVSFIPRRDASLPPLGRLDQESRGLLLLSEDGVLAKAIIGPDSGMEKEYRVRVAGPITPGKVDRLRHGLSLDGRALKPAKIDRLGEGVLRFTLIEGRNRQIRRMCRAVDLKVVDLLRLRIGPLKLGGLPEGKWRPLSEEERRALIESDG